MYKIKQPLLANRLRRMMTSGNMTFARMWSARNMTSPKAVAAVLVPVLMFTPVNDAVAQMTPADRDRAANQAPQGQLEAPLVDWSHAQQVFRMAEGWLADAQPGGPMEGQSIEVSGLSGVRITLRWMGLHMGTGYASFEANTPQPNQAMDLTQMTRTAMRGAMLQVNDKLRLAAGRGATIVEERDTSNLTEAEKAALPALKQPQTIADISRNLLMDIQIAGRLTTIRLEPDAPVSALYHQFAPGYHGLRLTSMAVDGTPMASWLWPADALATGLSPHGQMLQLMSGVGVKFNELGTIARPNGPKLESFEVIHMVRPGNHQPITRLTRGNVLLPPTSVDGRTLAGMNLRLVNHLTQRQRPSGQFAGTYMPSSDTYQSQQSSTEDGALACLAMTRWVRSGSAAANSPQVVSVNQTISRWLDANLRAMLDPEQTPSITSVSLTLLVLCENPAMVARKVERDMLTNRLLRLRNEDGSLRVRENAQAGLADAPQAALAVDALAASYLQTRNDAIARALPDTMTWVWEQTDPLRSISALPWLLNADARLETLTTREGQNAVSPRAPRAARMARLLPTIEIMMARQIVAPPAAGPADVIGGIELKQNDPSWPPNPDWRTAHMMMVISQSLRSSDLAVGRNRVEGLLACGRAARFLAQLMFDEPGAYYVRNPPEVIGGVRPVLWDNRLDIAPTAMTLLATCDLQETLRQWAATQ